MQSIRSRDSIPSGVCLATAVIAALMSSSYAFAQDSNLPASNTNVDDIRLRYAQKQLELSEIELKNVQGQNRRVPGSYSPLAIMQLEHDITQAKLRNEYEENRSTDPDSQSVLHHLHLNSLAAASDLAQKQLKWVLETNQRSPGLYRDDKVLRYRLRAELSGLALEKARDPDLTSSAIEHLQWQVNQLQSELNALRLELDRVHSTNK